MGLAFWRRNQAIAQTARAGTGADRDPERSDEEALLRRRTRHRLIGATALLLLAVVVVPLLLDADPRVVTDNVQITMPNAPPATASTVTVAPVTPAAPAPDKPVAIAADAPKSEPDRNESRNESKAAKAAGTDKPAQAGAQKEATGQDSKSTSSKEGAATPDKARVATADGGKFALQAAALSSERAARELAARLKQAGFKSYIEPVNTAAGAVHRVRVGPFDSRSSADKAREALRSAGFTVVLVDA